MHALLHSVPPTLQQATTDPRLCWRLLDTLGQVWVSLLWSQCLFLLCLSAHKVLFVPSKSLFSPSCASSGSCLVGLMATSFQRSHDALLHSVPRPRSRPLSTHAPTRRSWTLMGKSGSVSCGSIAPFSWVLGTQGYVCALQESFPSPV